MTAAAAGSVRVAVDVGGTFTDLVAYDESDGSLTIQKVPTTVEERSDGVLDALDAAGLTDRPIVDFIHGTTVGTNAVIEGTTSPTALLATRGYRDTLELMRADRPLPVYDMSWRKPEPLVPRDLRFDVDERIDAQGDVLEPLDTERLRSLLRSDAFDEVEAVAVSFLHSFLNDKHERLARRILSDERPELAVSLSCEVNPEVREYERASTVALDAMLKPLMSSYLRRLEDRLRSSGVNCEIFVMLANAGVLPLGSAVERPIFTLHSGPAGGVVGALLLGEALGRRDLITADMGGTSFDVCAIVDGAPRFRSEGEVRSGVPFRIPLVDIGTVGSGGGSLGWIDSGGLLRVGPRSAGADPGPACYGLGGQDATVTDACCALGYFGDQGLAAGTIQLDHGRARRAVEKLAATVGESTEYVAVGMQQIAVASMTAEIRKNSVERGLDPRDFSLLSFGGAGSMFAGALARELGIQEIIVPPHAGVFSAFGMLGAERRVDVERTVYGGLDDIDRTALSRAFDELESAARARLDSADATVARQISIRYVGQRHELRVRFRLRDVGRALGECRAEFDRLHGASYGHERPGDPVEIRGISVTATATRPKPSLVNPGRGRLGDAARGHRRVRLVHEPEARDVPVYAREELATGVALDGPAILEGPDATIVVESGQRASVHGSGALVIAC